MKTTEQKRKEAASRSRKYTFDNSRAKRRGEPEAVWQSCHEARLAHLESLTGR